MKYEDAMKLDKSTLAERLVNKGNGSKSSKFNPVKSDGLNIVVAGQEIGLGSSVFEETSEWHISPYQLAREKRYGKAIEGTVKNAFDWGQFSGKLVIGSTVAGFIANAVKRRGRTIRSGLFKLC